MGLPFILVLCMVGAFCLAPLAIYLLWLAQITRRSRPTILGGAWDYAGLLIGLSGFILFGGTVIAGTIVPIEERGKLMSLLYAFAYAGTVPTVALGYLGDAIGLTGSLLIFSIAASAIALFILLVGRRLFREVVPYVEEVVVAAAPPSGEAAPAR